MMRTEIDRVSGKKHYVQNNAFERWDFLKNHDLCAAETEGFRPISHSSTTRFKPGFYRRPLDKIYPDMEKKKLEHEDGIMLRAEKHAEKRLSHLTRKINCNGNVVKGSVPLVTPPKHTDEKRGRRHFDPSSIKLQDREQQIRDRTSIYRFYTSDAPRQQHPNRTVKQSSSMLGFGRSDIPSEGVLDNFVGHGYDDGQRPPTGSSGYGGDGHRQATPNAAATTGRAKARKGSPAGSAGETEAVSSSVNSARKKIVKGGSPGAL